MKSEKYKKSRKLALSPSASGVIECPPATHMRSISGRQFNKPERIGDGVKSEKGLVITYFGDGKGKTTAALGLALRASGIKKKVKIIQFIKGPWKSAEENKIKEIDNIELIKSGLGFVGILNDKIPIDEHKNSAAKGLEIAKESYKQKDLFILILDEILGAISTDLLKVDKVINLIKIKPDKLNLVLTGRPKIPKIIEISDLVTQMKQIKHPYMSGHLARPGIDY